MTARMVETRAERLVSTTLGAADFARGAADFLCLAAAPTFALMAVLDSVRGGNAHDMLCAAHGASPLSDMGWMYVLMSAFHATPWLRLIARKRY
jgi:hypothetical protein